MVKAAAVYAISLAGLASLAAPASRAQSAFGTSAGDCPVGIELATPMLSAPTTALELDAGRAHLDGYGVSTLSGGVNLRFRDQQLFTDTLDYDHPLRQARIDGPVDFRNAQGEVRSGSAQLDLDQDRAQFEDTRFRFVSGGRGQADALVLAPQQLDLRGVEYTTCDPQNPAWAIHGERITIDAERGQGVARNMQLRVADVPVLYLPWFRFPVGEQRQTGLLFPQLGSSDRTGFFLRWPLYLNLHPRADLTLTPEWLARRGLLLGGTARGLWTHGQGSLRARWLNNDQATDRERYEWGAELQTRLWPRIQAEIDYSDVSDIDFLRDLGQDNGDSRTNVLERRTELSWRPTTDLGLRARVVDFQILDPEVDGTVFTREPELVALYRPLNAWKGLRPRVRTEMVRFSDGGDASSTRLDVDGRVDFEHQGAGWDVQASTGWRSTEYRQSGALTTQRDLPSARIGVSLNLQRALRGGLIQTLRPRLDYLYTPFRDQRALPVFDTNLPDFSLDQLRSNNRFSGIDRISDENTLIPSVESAILDPASGIRRLRVQLGLQYRLQESRVALPGEEAGRDGASDWLLETDIDAANGIRGRAAAQYNTEQAQFDALSLGGRFLGADGRRLQLAYRFRRDLFEQVDLLGLWPLGGRWMGAARWVWALDESRSLETLAGVSYQSCCWGLTAGVRQFVNGTPGDYETGVFAQVAFKGLGQFGRGFEQIFNRDALSF